MNYFSCPDEKKINILHGFLKNKSQTNLMYSEAVNSPQIKNKQQIQYTLNSVKIRTLPHRTLS